MADNIPETAPLTPEQRAAAFEAQITALEAQIAVIHDWIMAHVAGQFPAPPGSSPGAGVKAGDNAK